ncbi:MAG TPA: 2Fe-2S iron-sulfur cluster-binding protein [Desulfobaccales bacterium]|nr:2Fe-2S iron-sulfur cluster-binding protein [Desulfobaccales bacterium]
MSSTENPQDGVINFFIDGQPVQAKRGWTILETARHHHIHIPTLCSHPAVTPWGSCRLCVVETRYGKRVQVIPSCLNPPVAELEVFTQSERVQNVRRWVLEMLLAQCPASREIKKLAAEHNVTSTRFAVTDPDEECLRCGLCVAVCNEVVGVRALTFGSRGVKKVLETPYRVPNNACIGCGCCVSVCPTGALQKRLDTVRGDLSRRTGHGFAH